MKQFLKSSEFRFIAVCLILMVVSTVACVKTQQEINQIDAQLELKKPMPGITSYHCNADGSTTFNFVKLFDGTTRYEDGAVTFSAGFTKIIKSNETDFQIADGGWMKIGVLPETFCPPTCPPTIFTH